MQAVELDVATLSPALDPDRLASLSTEELDLLIGLAEKGFLTLEQASDCPYLSRGGPLMNSSTGRAEGLLALLLQRPPWPLVLRRSSLGLEMHELERVFKRRRVRQLARRGQRRR